ncbi:MAG: trans-sulfuration enzyme family protein [Planctomycetota bacterium]|jgi:cystathionine beta-lyase/cystathionine gamma-synthase
MSRDANKARAHLRSRLIHGKFHTARWDFSHHLVPPISSTATFRLDTTARGARGFQQFAAPTSQKEEAEPIYIYDRLDEPTRGMLEDNLAEAEGGETAVTFASGMAAISATLIVLMKAGDHLLVHPRLYGCTYSLLTTWLPRLGIKTRFVDLTDLAAVRRAIQKRPRIIFFETPVNPTMELIDIQAIRKLVARRKISIVVDNTFATPFCQRPLALGANIVVHSLTKSLSGFGTDLGGAVIAPKRYEADLFLARKDFGGVLAGRNAWPILVYGLPTLSLRIREQERTAASVAEMLADHPRVKEVWWPGLQSHPMHDLARHQMQDWDGNFAPGTILYFVLKGRPAEARVACERLIDYMARKAYSVTLAVSLGQIRTLIEHPASMTHATIPAVEQKRRGIDPAGIRLSIGLEDPRDIMHDLLEALRKT